MFDDKRGCDYMKATHQQKKWWIPKVSMCLVNADHPSVILFCKRVLANLVSMHDDDWYTVLYGGETTTTFNKRMSCNDPSHTYFQDCGVPVFWPVERSEQKFVKLCDTHT